MKHISSESMRDKRIEVAAFLRSSDGQNRARLSHIHDILNGQPYQAYPNPPKTKEAENSKISSTEAEEKAFWHSFRIRGVISLFITILIYLAVLSASPKITPYLNTLKTTIKNDQTEILFDFIEQIPYTLEYEKINSEG